LATQITSQEIRFGEYVVDLRTGELRRNGAVLKLQPQPAKVLSILIGRPGQIVTRQELAEQVWGSETYVDFEHGLNYAIRQIRSVLEDDPERPRFLETIPKRGYRFIAPVINHATLEQVQSPVVTPDSDSSKGGRNDDQVILLCLSSSRFDMSFSGRGS
jgi:DNA-binding winged helix-turn-helix (wHTH) protein